LVDQLDRQADRPLLCGREGAACGARAEWNLRLFKLTLERADQYFVIGLRQRFAALDLLDHDADAVDDGKHRIHQPAVWHAPAAAHVGQGIFRRVAQRLELREIEETAVSLDGVDEAEDRIEPRALSRVGFPRDDLA